MTALLRGVLLILAFAMFLPGHVSAAEPVRTGLFSNTTIGGKDTVSYVADAARPSHRVELGDRRFEVRCLGATWRYASCESAERFAANPAAFVPRYNGHCANALSNSESLMTTDGGVWEFFGDQFHLFYSEGGRQRWLKGTGGPASVRPMRHRRRSRRSPESAITRGRWRGSRQ
jgi:hypothetical protein